MKSPARHLPSAKSQDRIWDIYIIFSAVGLLFSILFFVFLYNQTVQKEYADIQESTSRLVSSIDHELAIMTIGVRTMKMMAEDYILELSIPTNHPVEKLVSVQERDGYSLRTGNGSSADQMGSLTGIGPIPAVGSDTEKEMKMALSLTSIFRSLAARDSNIPWSYYTSAKKFLYVYPWVSEKDFFFSETTHELPFYSGATPENNPGRSLFWTPVYEASAGKGLMVTVSAPVYNGDQFLGSVSIDIVIKAFSWMLDQNPIEYSSTHIIEANGQPIYNPVLLENDIAVSQLLSDGRTDVGGYLVTVYPLQTVKWYIVIKTDKADVQKKAFALSIPYALMVLFLFCNFVLAAMLSRSQRRVRELSVRDSLTGLLNRRSFDETLRTEFSHIRRVGGTLALAILDIDYFKRYNDKYGHRNGDMILVTVASVLSQVLKRSSDYIFRIGGEEFAILAYIDNPDQLKPLMEKIRQSIMDQRIIHEDSPFKYLTISLGAVINSKENWMDVDVAYQKGDQALYQAKNSGRNRVIVDLGSD